MHPKAIYIHQGQQYHVERLDFEQRKAYVKRVNVDYYTDAIRYTQVRVLEIAEEEAVAGPRGAERMATCWCGRRWWDSRRSNFSRTKTWARASSSCRKMKCTRRRSGSRSSASCCESLPFALSDRQSGIFGLLYALESMATLLLMCDRRDLGDRSGRAAAAARESKRNGREIRSFPIWRPSTILRERRNSSSRICISTTRIPAESDSASRFIASHDLLLRRTRELILACPCEQGCPSCVGPAGERASGPRKRRWRSWRGCADRNWPQRHRDTEKALANDRSKNGKKTMQRGRDVHDSQSHSILATAARSEKGEPRLDCANVAWHDACSESGCVQRFSESRAIPDYPAFPETWRCTSFEKKREIRSHFITLTFWESLEAIRASRDDPVDRAKYYPEDRDYLLEFEPKVATGK